MSALYGIIGGIFLAQILSPENFNKASDYFSPIYAVIVIAIIMAYKQRPIPKKQERVYTLEKKELTWKQKFIGTWDKTERPGFKEFAIFMGQSSMIAGYAEAQPFGNVIQFQDASEKVMKIDLTGVPAQAGAWAEVDGPAVESKDAKGNPIMDKIWWNEEEKKLYRSLTHFENAPLTFAADVIQIREITEDDRLIATATLTRRKDGQSCSFKAVFKRA